MQISGAGHSLGISTGRTARWGSSLSGSDVNSDPRLGISRSGGGASDEGVSTGISAAGTLARTTGVSGDSPSAGAALLPDVAAGSTAVIGGSGLTSSAPEMTGLGDAR